MQNSFVTFDRENLILTVHFGVKGDLVIHKEDLFISYFSGGPGGQNVNRHQNGVRLIYTIPPSYRRYAVRTQELIARSIAERNQHQNLLLAFGQLAKKLHDYFYTPPFRKKTKVSRRSKEKRLETKKHQSSKKQTRQKVELS
ncbi:hypothetical protein COY07_00700 [Candidatus Peregrinibacteria bacterium CG_4_10_14_0_2_um_filter_43_11]|nr:MAG: hypothetical protein COY07_00700 [Candidatus Peregrinibacteria bacterium CG_4_10_14_0_2_um_filter_43_11]